ncbi:hypothetical protein KBC75_03150 [Candidatus Shapirobacteria bacterium]|nr:hypothetical protein [Candidatus Shapirobacteria bacterium]
MTDTTIQAPDISNDNPLQAEAIATEIATEGAKIKKAKDPKTKLLIGLGVTIAILLPLSFLVPNKNNQPKVTVIPTPTPLAVQSGPTQVINPDQIPQNIQPQFDTIRNLISQPDLIPVPEIDDTTGRQ